MRNFLERKISSCLVTFIGRVNANDGVLFLFPKAIIALLSLIDYTGIITFFDAKRNQVAFLFTDCTHSLFIKNSCANSSHRSRSGLPWRGFCERLVVHSAATSGISKGSFHRFANQSVRQIALGFFVSQCNHRFHGCHPAFLSLRAMCNA